MLEVAADLAALQFGIASENGDDVIATAHRNTLADDPGRARVIDAGGLPIALDAHDVPGGQRLEDLRMILAGGQGADQIVGLDRRRGGGPALSHADHIGAVGDRADADPELQIGERQIRQQLPITHHTLQMIHRRTG